MVGEPSESVEQDLSEQPLSRLGVDSSRDTNSSALSDEVVRRARDANQQRQTLFRYIIGVVTASFLVVIAVLICVGLGWLVIPSAALVALISALAIQSFALVGLLARGLFAPIRDTSVADTLD